jgi:hypothetical protein
MLTSNEVEVLLLVAHGKASTFIGRIGLFHFHDYTFSLTLPIELGWSVLAGIARSNTHLAISHLGSWVWYKLPPLRSSFT